MKQSKILGISAFYHDAAAALVVDGNIVAAAQEERFSRCKHDPQFPRKAVAFCLKQARLGEADLDEVVFYDKPITKFTRMLDSYLAVAPHGFSTFHRVLPSWLSEKLNVRQTISDELPCLSDDCRIRFTEHHQAHAASCFYPSPFRQSAILTVNGVGEWATTTIGFGHDHHMEIISELLFPHSLGLLYTAFTTYCGFLPNSGEYKLMGLAPFGQPRYVQIIYDNLLDLKADGSFWLNMHYFSFLRGLTMTNARFHNLFGAPPRSADTPVDSLYADVAASIQVVTNEVMLRLARQAKRITGQSRLCIAGGVALNCVANGLIQRSNLFEQLWFQPAASDAGGALGAALAAWHEQFPKSPNYSRTSYPEHLPDKEADEMEGALLGPEYSDTEIATVLQSFGAVYDTMDRDALLDHTVKLLSQGKIIGWFHGRMEFGPRALGNRSILADPRPPGMQFTINMKVKFRESFRPFAPVVLWERCREYFDLSIESPYMLLVGKIRENLCRSELPPVNDVCERAQQVRSTIPAVTHVDYSARIQTLKAAQNPLLYSLLQRFAAATGCPVLINTSLNVHGEPIVCTPDDAYRCLINTKMDCLVIGPYILERDRQPYQQLVNTYSQFPSAAVRLRFRDGPVDWQKFTLFTAVLTGLLAYILCARGMYPVQFAMALWLIIALVLLANIFRPAWFRDFYRLSRKIGVWVSTIVGCALTSLLFMFILTPLSWFLRCMGKDLLQLKHSSQAISYWQTARGQIDLDRMF